MGKLESDPIQREKAKNFIQQDYARVDIYYQTLNVKDIKQSAVIGVSVSQKFRDCSIKNETCSNRCLSKYILKTKITLPV